MVGQASWELAADPALLIPPILGTTANFNQYQVNV